MNRRVYIYIEFSPFIFRNMHKRFTLGVIIFSSVRFLLKKNNQTEFFFFKKTEPNRTEPGSNRPVSVRFLGQKPVWLGFFRFGSGPVRFSFFGF